MHRTHRHLQLVPPLPDQEVPPGRLPSYDELDAALDDIVDTLAAVQAADDARHAALLALRADHVRRSGRAGA